MVIEINTAQLVGALGFIGGAGTMAAVLWTRVIRPARRVLGLIEEIYHDWSGVPDRPGVPGRKGVMERLMGVEAELKTNGGKSLRDAVRRTETAVAEIRAQMDGATLIALPRPAQPAAEGTTAKDEAA